MPLPSANVRSADRLGETTAAVPRAADCATDGIAQEIDATRRTDPARANTRFLMTFLMSQRDGVYRSPSMPGAAHETATPGVRSDHQVLVLLLVSDGRYHAGLLTYRGIMSPWPRRVTTAAEASFLVTPFCVSWICVLKSASGVFGSFKTVACTETA